MYCILTLIRLGTGVPPSLWGETVRLCTASSGFYVVAAWETKSTSPETLAL